MHCSPLLCESDDENNEDVIVLDELDSPIKKREAIAPSLAR